MDEKYEQAKFIVEVNGLPMELTEEQISMMESQKPIEISEEERKAKRLELEKMLQDSMNRIRKR